MSDVAKSKYIMPFRAWQYFSTHCCSECVNSVDTRGKVLSVLIPWMRGKVLPFMSVAILKNQIV